jgi:hypothetical protein
MRAIRPRDIDDRIAVSLGLDVRVVEALRRERRHAAVAFLATGMALGIAFALAVDMAVTAAARV